MPANLSPEYYRAEEDYRNASSAQERLFALKKMLAAIPKHKGTEKMQADLKRKISLANEEIQKTGKRKGFSIKVEKEGGGQVCIVGPPNSGKTQLVSTLTDTQLEVASYPFTTRMPHPAMMKYDDIQIQLVDLPPVCSQHMEYWVPNIVRTCDLVLLIIDLSDNNLLDGLEDTISVLNHAKLEIVKDKPKDEFWASTIQKHGWLVGTKTDKKPARENWNVVKELYFDKFGLSAVSAKSGEEIERLRNEIFSALEIIRVYTKPPGKPVDTTQPYVLKKNSTLLNFAQTVHKDFSEHLRFARIWGHSKFDGQKVNRDYILQDKDIIELHM